MKLEDKVVALERKILSGGNITEAKKYTNLLLTIGIITAEQYDEALRKAIRNGSNIKDVMDALDGRSVGLPSARNNDTL